MPLIVVRQTIALHTRLKSKTNDSCVSPPWCQLVLPGVASSNDDSGVNWLRKPSDQKTSATTKKLYAPTAFAFPALPRRSASFVNLLHPVALANEVSSSIRSIGWHKVDYSRRA